jgi:hypothetical protein
MSQKHIVAVAVHLQRKRLVLHQASVAQKAAFRRKQVAAPQVQAVYRGMLVLVLVMLVRILMFKRSFHHLELLHHLVHVALSQAALIAQQISRFQVRLANPNQVVARKGCFAQSAIPPKTTSTTAKWGLPSFLLDI